MTIKIKNHQKNFTVIDNTILRDERLSWQAKGLHTYLMHLPDDWKVSVEDLKKRSANGRDATSAILKELVDAGYIERTETREFGKFSGYEYTVYPSPFTGKPETVKPETENPTLLSTIGTKKEFSLHSNSCDEPKQALLITSDQLTGATAVTVEPVAKKRKQPVVDPLYAPLLAAFEERNGQFANYGKECRNLKSFIAALRKRFPNENHELVAAEFLNTFAALRDADRFWSEQPLTPSSALSLFERLAQRVSDQINERRALAQSAERRRLEAEAHRKAEEERLKKMDEQFERSFLRARGKL